MELSDRSERLLALIFIHQIKAMPQREKALQLSLAGFTNTEIADLLQTTSAVISQALYETRRGVTNRSSTRASRRPRRK